MWKKGLLGDSTHESLLNTVIFYKGLYFTLRSGKEHRQLRYSPCQIQLIEQPGLRTYLQYTGDVSKNHPGGLRGQKITPKCVVYHSNTKRWSVTLFKKYTSSYAKKSNHHQIHSTCSHHTHQLIFVGTVLFLLGIPN